MVSIPIFGMIRGVGRLSLELGLGRSTSLLSRWIGKWGNLVTGMGGLWVWDHTWRRALFVWEADMLSDLLVVATRRSMVEREDVWSWTLSLDGRYSVKSAYSSLIKGLTNPGIPHGEVL